MVKEQATAGDLLYKDFGNYSGSDTKVYVYRDTSRILKAKSADYSFRDGTVKLKDNPSSSSVQSFSTELSPNGVITKGTYQATEGIYQKNAPTNASDLDYYNLSRDISFNQNTKLNSSATISTNNQAPSLVTELGSIYSYNYSVFREKVAVRTLGRVHPKGYTRGQRTIAGNMIFSVLRDHELLSIANASRGEEPFTMIDQIEPFNVILAFANEYGSMSAMHFFGVELSTESQDMSIDNILITNNMTFYCQDMLPMEYIGNVYSDKISIGDTFTGKVLSKLKADGLQLNSTRKIESAILGGTDKDLEIQKRLKRSRGLF